MKHIYYTAVKKGYKSLSELDFNLYKEVLGDIDYDMAYPMDIGETPSVEGEPINIDYLIGILSELKEKGANYVSIDSNFDHHGYDIEAYSIKPCTDIEVEDYFTIKEQEKKQEKKREYERLMKKIEDIKKEL